MAKFGRDKGKRGERATATELREAFPKYAAKIKRGWQTRQGDDDSDVVFPGLWVEVKTLAKFNTSPYDQALRDAKGRGLPIAVIRPNHKKPVAMLSWVDLLELLKLRFAGDENGTVCKGRSGKLPRGKRATNGGSDLRAGEGSRGRRDEGAWRYRVLLCTSNDGSCRTSVRRVKRY